MRLARYLIIALGTLALAAGPAISDRGRKTGAESRAFSIDGRRFLLEEAADDSRAPIERELSRMGVDPLRLSQHLASVVDVRTVTPLREEPCAADRSSFPAGLNPEHVLKLESDTGTVEIAFGRLPRGRQDFLRQLRSSGWECTESDSHGISGLVAQLTTRKESRFVFLEKGEGRFLAIRRPLQ